MEKLEGAELARLTWDRPTLKKELEATAEVWKLPAGAGDIRTMEHTLMLLARYKNGGYRILMAPPPRGKNPDGSKKADKVTTWLFNPDALVGMPASEAGADFITIPKSRLGRKKRIVSDAERAEILSRHKNKENIHSIAKALHMGTARVSEVIKASKTD